MRESEGKHQAEARRGAGPGAGLTEWPQVSIQCGCVFPIQLFSVSHALKNQGLGFSFCQPLLSEMGVAENNAALIQ